MGELFRLTHADLKPAIAVLARSLHDVPLFRRLIPDDDRRIQSPSSQRDPTLRG